MRSGEKQQQMYAIVKEYESGRDSLPTVATRHGIPYKRLMYWRRKYMRSSQEPTAGFIQMTAPLLAGTTLRYPNGVELTLPATASTALVRELICLYPA
jgi:transposase-like protein